MRVTDQVGVPVASTTSAVNPLNAPSIGDWAECSQNTRSPGRAPTATKGTAWKLIGMTRANVVAPSRLRVRLDVVAHAVAISPPGKSSNVPGHGAALVIGLPKVPA